MRITKQELIPYIGHCLDDALSVRRAEDMPDNARLVVYQCGFETRVIAVWSYLGCRLDEYEAEEIATDYLLEIGQPIGPALAAYYVI